MCIQILKENQVVKNNTCIHTYIKKIKLLSTEQYWCVTDQIMKAIN